MRKILFDLFGVIMNGWGDEDRHMIARAARAEETVGFDAFMRAYDKPRPPFDAGLIDFEEFLAIVGEDLGVEFPDIDVMLDAEYESVQAQNDEMVAYVEELAAAGVDINLLSNLPRHAGEGLTRDKPFMSLFKTRTMSYETGHAKPEPEIYEIALAKMGAAPEDVLFLDDNPVNVAAARELGINAVVFTGIDDARAAIDAFLGDERVS